MGQLFDGNAFREVTGLVDIETPCAGYVVAKELERNDCEGSRKELIYLGNIDYEVRRIFDGVVSEGCEGHEISTARLGLYKVAKGLLIKTALGEDTDNKRAFLDEADRAVLKLTCRDGGR